VAKAVGFVIIKDPPLRGSESREGSVVVVRQWVVYNGGVLPKTV
jgi:hypothetical protein